jgi:hypothetical protein
LFFSALSVLLMVADVRFAMSLSRFALCLSVVVVSGAMVGVATS